MGVQLDAPKYTYLKRGVYYFVRRIPSDLQGFYRADRVIISLRTKSAHRASHASQRLSARLDDFWLDLRLQKVDVPGSHLLRDSVSKRDNILNSLGVSLSCASEMYQRLKGKGRSKLFFGHTQRAIGYAIACLGDLDLAEYSTVDAGKLRDWLFEKGLKRSSVVRNLTIVKAVVNLAIHEEGLGIQNPFLKVYVPSDEQPSKRHALSIEQIRLAQRHCRTKDDSLRWLCALISDTGMRLSEAVGLAKDDLRLHSETPHLVIQKHPWRSLKTSGSERIVPLVGEALWAAQRLSQETSGPFLFPQYVNGQTTGSNSASAALNKWLKTFLPKDCVVHGMRHAFRDRLRAGKVPIDMIDQLGGWSSQTIGQRYGDGYSVQQCREILASVLT